MKPFDAVLLLLLAAVWGASYLFMRVGAGEFGALAFAGVRAAVAVAVLLPLLARRHGLGMLRAHWGALALVGLTNSALPFVLFSFAALTLSAGLSAIFSAATPLYAALIGWLWLRDRLTAPRLTGIAIGFLGVVWLAWDKAHVRSGGGGADAMWACAACVLATLLYGFSANFAKRRLGAVPPLAAAAGSNLASALVLAWPAVHAWPAQPPSLRAWAALLALGVVGTAFAYALYFRLVASVGAARTVTVSFLIPAFGVLWGALFLGEPFTPQLALGCAIILVGTGLTTGVLRLGVLLVPALAANPLR